jgi:ADP-heptose:LPS heptosyltransferase
MLEKIIVCRRDNIGDLVLTTPLIFSLKNTYPNCRLDAYVNDYTRDVLVDLDCLSNIYSYLKSKHAGGVFMRLAGVVKNAYLLIKLRLTHYDKLFFVGNGLAPKNQFLIKFINAKKSYCFGKGQPFSDSVEVFNSRDDGSVSAAVEIFDLLKLVNIVGVPGPTRVQCSEASRDFARAIILENFLTLTTPCLHLHLSARKLSQRWSVNSYYSLLQKLSSKSCNFIVTWSPGSIHDAKHPGDDEKVDILMSLIKNDTQLTDRVLPIRTNTVAELKGVLSFVSLSICPDGGAMHLLAGLGKPIVALFGDSDSIRWAPWGSVTPCVLQKSTRVVDDITPDEVFEAVNRIIIQEKLDV